MSKGEGYTEDSADHPGNGVICSLARLPEDSVFHTQSSRMTIWERSPTVEAARLGRARWGFESSRSH